MTTAQLGAIIIALLTGGGLTAGINWFSSRKTSSATAIKVYTETTLLLLEPMKHEIERLEERIRVASDQLVIAAALLRQNAIEWPAGTVPPPWS